LILADGYVGDLKMCLKTTTETTQLARVETRSQLTAASDSH